MTTAPDENRTARWPRSKIVTWWRRAALTTTLVPLVRLGYRIDVRGKSNFTDATQPFLIASNHNIHLDWAVLLAVMPARVRKRISIAVSADDIFANRFRRLSSQAAGNAFPLQQSGGGVRESLETVLQMLSDRWNVLIFPEGERTADGPIKPFQRGIGWLAIRSGVDVVPIRIEVLRRGGLDGRWWPHPRGHVRVSIGKPLRASTDTTYGEFADAVRKAVDDA